MAVKTNCVKNGTAYYRLTATVGKKPDGKPDRKDFYGVSKKDAEHQRDEYIESRKNQGLNADYRNMSLGELMYIWLFEVRLPSDNSPNTFARYENIYRNHIKSSDLYNMKPSDITKLVLQRFYNQQIEAGKTSKTVASINKVLKIFFFYAVENDIVLKNPCSRIALPKDKIQDADEKNTEAGDSNTDDEDLDLVPPLSSNEISIIKKNITGNRIEMLFLLSLGTGIRQGEALALTFKDVDLKNEQVRITKTLIKAKIIHKDGTHEYKLFTKSPKTKNSRRVVAIPSGLIASLKRYINQQKEKYLKNGIPFDEGNRLFTTDTCTCIDSRNLLRAWERLLKKSGVEYRKWHVIRHTYATKLFEKRVPIKTVQMLMGHSSILTTERIYIHVMPEEKETAVNELNFLFQ